MSITGVERHTVRIQLTRRKYTYMAGCSRMTARRKHNRTHFGFFFLDLNFPFDDLIFLWCFRCPFIPFSHRALLNWIPKVYFRLTGSFFFWKNRQLISYFTSSPLSLTHFLFFSGNWSIVFVNPTKKEGTPGFCASQTCLRRSSISHSMSAFRRYWCQKASTWTPCNAKW